MPQTATVLRFDPQSRQSSRRQSDAACDRRAKAADRRQAKALADALKISVGALESDALLSAYAPALRVIEAAYRQSSSAGRKALMGTLSAEFDEAYESGLKDGQMDALIALRG